MLVSLALIAASIAVPAPANDDPSLSAIAMCGTPTTAVLATTSSQADNNGVLLSYDGILLTWDESSETFGLSLNGSAVTDLVTENDGKNPPSFAGLWTGASAGVFGTVDDPSGKSWTVTITRPAHFPQRFGVVSVGNGTQVTSAKSCECADGVGMSCKTYECDNGSSCSAATSTCKWKTISAGS